MSLKNSLPHILVSPITTIWPNMATFQTNIDYMGDKMEESSSTRKYALLKSDSSMETVVFTTNHRAQFDEIDPFGHLNNTRYLSYINQHRFEGMRKDLNLNIKNISAMPFAFYTKKFEIEYHNAIFMDQEFIITSVIENLGISSARVNVLFLSTKNKILAEAVITLVCVDKSTLQSTQWPTTFLDLFFRHI